MLEFFNEGMKITIELINNAVLLFALTFIYGATNFNPASRNIKLKVVLSLFLGGIAMLVMLNPWYSETGIFYDTRSILYSVIGAYFGFLTTGISVLIGVIIRISLGGVGVYAGTLSIIVTAIFGLSWNKIREYLPKKTPRIIEFYIFGLIASGLSVLCQFALPADSVFKVIQAIIFPFIGLFPLVTVVIMLAIRNQIHRLNATEDLKTQQLLLQASIDSTTAMEIFALNAKYQYLAFNQFHFKSMQKYYQKNVVLHSNYLHYIEDKDMYYRIKSFIDKALLGESFRRTIEVEDQPGKFLEELYTPIKNQENDIIGVTVFSQEITERKNYEESILYLSYHDPLTSLNNRRFYSEELMRLDTPEYYPLSIIMGDINGLKIMNDAFGHDAGDTLLKTVADELNTVFSGHANVSRVGGDEFVILLKNTSKQEALTFVDKAKTQIEKNVLHGMKVSVSFGISTKEGDIPTHEIIKFAEDDMYKHKLFEVSSNRNESIQTILHTLHLKNPREEYHSKRVSEYCVKIGKILELRQDEIELLKVIGNLHDIGKIAIDEAILNKPAKLNIEEFASIKRHPEIGYRILSSSREYTEFAQDILSHHEHYDGTGYPQGLKGQDIPYRARIIAIADAFDAMTSSRPYRQALSIQEALDEIIRCAGTQFDPIIASKFVENMRKQKAK